MWAVVLVRNGQFVEVLSDGLLLSGALAFAAGLGVTERGTPVVMPSNKAMGDLSELLAIFDAADQQTRAAMLQASRKAMVDALTEKKEEVAGEAGADPDSVKSDADPSLRALFVLVDHAENGPCVNGEAIQGSVATALVRCLEERGHGSEIRELRLPLSEVLARSHRVAMVPHAEAWHSIEQRRNWRHSSNAKSCGGARPANRSKVRLFAVQYYECGQRIWHPESLSKDEALALGRELTKRGCRPVLHRIDLPLSHLTQLAEMHGKAAADPTGRGMAFRKPSWRLLTVSDSD